MVRRGTVALAVVSALSALPGCVGSPPTGPLVEVRDGITPITRPSPCEATYVLRPADDPSAQMAVVHVPAGVRVGFRRERDQTVSAVGPKLVVPLDPGAYVWEVVPGSVPPWKKRAKQECRQVAFAVLRAIGLSTAFLLEHLEFDDDPKPGPGEPNGVIIPAHHHDQKP